MPAELHTYYCSNLHEKMRRWIPLIFESDLNQCLHTKKKNTPQKSGFSHLLIIELFLKSHTGLGRGMHSLSDVAVNTDSSYYY